MPKDGQERWAREGRSKQEPGGARDSLLHSVEGGGGGKGEHSFIGVVQQTLQMVTWGKKGAGKSCANCWS
jgi:hypothetical protein